MTDRELTDRNESLGTIEHREGVFHARLERLIPHPPTAVWAMLTEPAKFVDWLAPGEIELAEGGSAKLNFVDSGIVIDSTVSAYRQDRLLEYSWSGPGEPTRPVRFEISSENDGTRLVLQLSAPDDEDMARSCAGWEAHLMMLLAAMEGVPIRFPFERFQASRAEYNKLINAD